MDLRPSLGRRTDGYSPRLYNSWLKHCGDVSTQGVLDMVGQKARQDAELLTDAFCCSNRDTRHRSATLHRRCLSISVPCHTNNTTDCRQPALTRPLNQYAAKRHVQKRFV